MARFLKIEKEFLQRRNVDERWIMFRSRDKTCSGSKDEMRRADKWILHGFYSSCSCGSTLTSSGGVCLICHPKKLEKTLPYIEPGFVYLAHAAGTSLFKVGATGDLARRLAEHRSAGLAGMSDWRLLDCRWALQRGVLEDRILVAMKPHRYTEPYNHYGREVISKELFGCSLKTALNVFSAACPPGCNTYATWRRIAKQYQRQLAES